MGKRKKFTVVKIGKLSDELYREALTQGFKVLINQRREKDLIINQIYDMARECVKKCLEIEGIGPTNNWAVDVAAMALIKATIEEME